MKPGPQVGDKDGKEGAQAPGSEDEDEKEEGWCEMTVCCTCKEDRHSQPAATRSSEIRSWLILSDCVLLRGGAAFR